MDPYPLIFEPIYKRRIWGGRRLQTVLGKNLPPDVPIGESWELSGLQGEETTVAVGPARGKTVGEMLSMWGDALTGRAALPGGRFPLLLKFLDAQETLSVQVHPDAATAGRSGSAAHLKNEAWYVVDALPNSVIYRGVRPGVTENELRRALAEGTVEQLLVKIPARKGHAFYLPSGTIHALGAGLLVAEVQTPSDTTYRLYDWDRIDPATGRPRELHIEDALVCADYGPCSIEREKTEHTASVWTSVTSLVRCESFTIERVRMVEGVEQPIPYAEMVIWMVLEGSGLISCDALKEPLRFTRGDTVLLPAALKNARVAIQAATMWLEITVPVPSSLAGYEHPGRAEFRPPSAAGLVDLQIGGQKPPNRPSTH